LAVKPLLTMISQRPNSFAFEKIDTIVIAVTAQREPRGCQLASSTRGGDHDNAAQVLSSAQLKGRDFA
jgi:hypothetical protein